MLILRDLAARRGPNLQGSGEPEMEIGEGWPPVFL